MVSVPQNNPPTPKDQVPQIKTTPPMDSERRRVSPHRPKKATTAIKKIDFVQTLMKLSIAKNMNPKQVE